MDRNADGLDTRFLRPLKAAKMKEIAAKFEDRSGLLQVRHFNNIRLTAIGQHPGASYGNHDDLFVDDCDFCVRFSGADTIPPSKECLTIHGKVLYGGYLRNQWGHFLLNTTARLWPLFSPGCPLPPEFDKILFFSDSPDIDTLSGNFLRYMTLAGLADKIVITDKEAHIPGELIVPDISLEHPDWYAREFLDIHRKVTAEALLLRPDIQAFPKKIFLTRSRLPNANENELELSRIDDFFISAGFSILYPEKLDLVTFIHYMQNAEEIAIISGSLAHNTLFARSDAKVYIIERTAYCNIYQVALSLISPPHPLCIDAFWLPENAPGVGQLFLYGFTPQLIRFANDKGIPVPENHKVTLGTLQRFVDRFYTLYGGKYPPIKTVKEDDPTSEAFRETMSQVNSPRPLRPSLKPLLISWARRLLH